MELMIKSSIDGTYQPSLFFEAEGKRPLLVGLHTWSFNRFNQKENLLPYVKEYNWNLLLPEFRGPNKSTNPNCREACGSQLAIRDIIDAVEFVKSEYEIDETKIFLLGASGGGHMALLATAYAPTLWQAVASFVPITDLTKWYDENKYYAADVMACCGGVPPEVNPDEYKMRSPMTYLEELSKANLKIFHGKYDPVVSVTHSMELYLEMLKLYPQSRTFLEIFDGRHEILNENAINWFNSQTTVSHSVKVTG